MVSLREAMNRLFEDSFGRSGSALAPFEGMALAMDVKETKDDVIVKTAVPGVQPDDIDISLTGDTLTIKGEFKAEEKKQGETFVRQERAHGKFERMLALPTMIEADKAKAEFENGVLTLPKAEAVKPKTIKIKAK